MKRVLIILLFVASLAPGFTLPAEAGDTAKPNYTGVNYIVGNGSIVIERNGRYYMAAVSHRGGSLGDVIHSYKPTFWHVGTHAYKSDFWGSSLRPDYTLIDMGTTKPSTRVRVSHQYWFNTLGGKFVYGETQTTPAPTGADWTYGSELCFTAWPKGETDKTTVRVVCGVADNTVSGSKCSSANAVPYCGIRSRDGSPLIQSGDSGGLVWAPMPYGQVRPIGLISQGSYDCAALPCKAGLFAPFYGFTKYPFSASETLAGYPPGAGGRVVTG